MMHPADAVGQSYTDTYNRTKNLNSENIPMSHSTKMILTDRGQYMNYLEAQLDRVTMSLLAQNTLSERMGEVDGLIQNLDERINSVTKVARLSQTFSERWGEDTSTTVNRLTERIAAIEGMIGGNQSSHEETKSLISNVTDHISNLERLRLEAKQQTDEQLQSMEKKVTAINNANIQSSTTFITIDKRFEEMEKVFSEKVEEVEKRADEKVKNIQQQLEAKFQQHQRASEVKLTEHNAELARLRHEASLMENRMLAALAKQANVAQEQIQTIHNVVQETLLGKTTFDPSGSFSNSNKFGQIGSWEEDESENDSYGGARNNRGRVGRPAAIPRELLNDVDDLIDTVREQKKTLREHEAMLTKHDKAGMAVEETAEALTANMKKLETAVEQLAGNWGNSASQLSDKLLKTIAELEAKFGTQLSQQQSNLSEQVSEIKTTFEQQIGTVQGKLAESQSSSEAEDQQQKMSVIVQEAEERILKKQEDLLRASQESLTDQLHHQYKKQKKKIQEASGGMAMGAPSWQQQLAQQQQGGQSQGSTQQQETNTKASRRRSRSQSRRESKTGGGLSTRDLKGFDEYSDSTPPQLVVQPLQDEEGAREEEENEEEHLNKIRRKIERERRQEAALERTLRDDDSDASEDELYNEVVTRKRKDGKRISSAGAGKKGAGSSKLKNRHKDAWVPAKTVPSKTGSRSVSPAGRAGAAEYLGGGGGGVERERLGTAATTTTMGSLLSEATSTGKAKVKRKKSALVPRRR
ncbi:hypothetical protein TrLO_g12738 [Triparma laevis f. longispina]|uniref:Uncharacterized protein n=1 Tax=Triparma laevis f. longispina TaxID=1714387 RepID=A0A9W6ZF42_9STRA|nr:hypothetical protein TrLO_g12738 [Triparma laevis f. longispina]